MGGSRNVRQAGYICAPGCGQRLRVVHLRKRDRNGNAVRRVAACVVAVACLAGIAGAQTPPTYTSIPMEITVDRPAAEVWKRIGKYCDIAEWLQNPAGCTITSGKDGEFGA